MSLFLIFIIGLGIFLYTRKDQVAEFFIRLLKIPEYLEKYEKGLSERQAKILLKNNDGLKGNVQGYLIRFEEAMTYNFEEKSHIEKVDMEAYLESKEVLKKLKSQHWNPNATLFSRYLIGGFEIKYSPIPRNELFFGENITDVRDEDESVFELLFPENEPEKMLFRFIDDPAVLGIALKFPDEYISSVCEVIGKGDITQAKYIEYTYGIAQKDGVNFRMRERAAFRYFLDSPSANSLTGELIHHEDEKEEKSSFLTHETFQKALEDLKFKMEQNFQEKMSEAFVKQQVIHEQTNSLKTHSKVSSEGTKGKVLYSPAPTNGLFRDTNLSEEFIPNESIYKITFEEDTSPQAQFSVVEDPDVQYFALNIPDDYLRPAVHLQGEIELSDAVQLETIEMGKLHKDDNSWKILKKAVLKFY